MSHGGAIFRLYRREFDKGNAAVNCKNTIYIALFVLLLASCENSGDDALPPGPNPPAAAGTLVFSLTVTDNLGAISSDSVMDFPEIIAPLKDSETSGFHIDEYRLNKDQWDQGFVSA